LEDDISDYLIENKYTNKDLRQSFSIEIWTCSKTRNKNCKTDLEIKRFLETFYFTFYTLLERAEFSAENQGKSPMVT
jgi:hypothetical protein